jgi:2-oxoglutarate ferredoxin oxidoreductase subunit beta
MAAAPKTNKLGLMVKDYRGGASTLCKGCGHDVITNTIVSAFYEMGVEPHMVAKLSGIGCSSKTPAYFLNGAWGFNSVHGRMPAIATGSALANRDLLAIGVSGDGDTASIGMGQFVHMLRRNTPVVYLVENNGVYGLTKGQFSATADEGSVAKGGATCDLPPIDLCTMAIELGCGFVARSFSGDRKQLLQILKAAIAYEGTAMIDILSPCVTFNNHKGSTKSYDWGKGHEGPVHELGFVPHWEEPSVEFEGGSSVEVALPGGGVVWIKPIDENKHDPRDRVAALTLLREDYENEAVFNTGIMYLDPSRETLQDDMDMSATRLWDMPLETLRPTRESLDEIVDSLR